MACRIYKRVAIRETAGASVAPNAASKHKTAPATLSSLSLFLNSPLIGEDDRFEPPRVEGRSPRYVRISQKRSQIWLFFDRAPLRSPLPSMVASSSKCLRNDRQNSSPRARYHLTSNFAGLGFRLVAIRRVRVIMKRYVTRDDVGWEYLAEG